MPTRSNPEISKQKLDPVNVMVAIFEETPELKEPLLERGLIEEDADGHVTIVGIEE